MPALTSRKPSMVTGGLEYGDGAPDPVSAEHVSPPSLSVPGVLEHTLCFSSSSQFHPGTLLPAPSNPFPTLVLLGARVAMLSPRAGFGAFCLGNCISLLDLGVLLVPGGQLPALG